MDQEQKKSFLTPCGKGEFSIAQLKGNLHPEVIDGCKFHLFKELKAGKYKYIYMAKNKVVLTGFLVI